jgi:hypothetical protein
LIEWGVASKALAGEARSGDLHVVQPFPGGVLVAAVDGLGHGDEAAQAAAAAADILSRHADEPVVCLVQRCHEGLMSTRGAVMSVASINGRTQTMSWLGVGNVEALLLPGGSGPSRPRTWLMLRGGVVGYRLPRLLESTVAVCPGDLLIMTTDGVEGAAFIDLQTSDPPRQVAEGIVARCSRGVDDALALVVRYAGDV